MTQYILPCQCGEKVVIDVAQAGQTVVCRCGQTLAIPTLLAIRRLEPALTVSVEHPSWGGREKLLFVGLVILIVAVLIAAYALLIRPRPLPPTTREAIRAQLDGLKVLETMYLWNFLTTGLRTARPPAEIRHEEAQTRYHIWLGLAATVGLAGLSFCGSAWFWRQPRKPSD